MHARAWNACPHGRGMHQSAPSRAGASGPSAPPTENQAGARQIAQDTAAGSAFFARAACAKSSPESPEFTLSTKPAIAGVSTRGKNASASSRAEASADATHAASTPTAPPRRSAAAAATGSGGGASNVRAPRVTRASRSATANAVSSRAGSRRRDGKRAPRDPDASRHAASEPSATPARRKAPSGENATDSTAARAPTSAHRHEPVCRSQRRTVRSSEALANTSASTVRNVQARTPPRACAAPNARSRVEGRASVEAEASAAANAHVASAPPSPPAATRKEAPTLGRDGPPRALFALFALFVRAPVFRKTGHSAIAVTPPACPFNMSSHVNAFVGVAKLAMSFLVTGSPDPGSARTLQTRTVPSSPPVATRSCSPASRRGAASTHRTAPSDGIASAAIGFAGAFGVAARRRGERPASSRCSFFSEHFSSADQTRATPSPEPVTRNAPSGLNARLKTLSR